MSWTLLCFYLTLLCLGFYWVREPGGGGASSNPPPPWNLKNIKAVTIKPLHSAQWNDDIIWHSYYVITIQIDSKFMKTNKETLNDIKIKDIQIFFDSKVKKNAVS